MSDIAIGTVIGGYQILEAIGQGGMATVYRAHQLSMKRDVAIKMLPRQFLSQSNSLDRFKQEANIVARLEHRAIVPVHDYGEYEGVPYLVMRYMDGGSVDDLIYRGPVAPDRTLDILLQIAPALDYAHQNGVLHRDLKPSNILMDTNGDAYLTDFGIARLLGEGSTSLTTTGVVGTPSYMSPEQAQGHDLDGRSDVYALGVVLFEMLVGSRPFEGETPYSVAVKHVTQAPPSAREKNPNLTTAIEQVLFKALAKDPDQRYQTAGELATALQAAITEDVGPSPPATSMQQLPESMIETEPSLEQALREGEARQRVDTSRALLTNPAPRADSPAQSVDSRPASPQLQVLSPYVAPPASGAYPRSARQPQSRRLRSRTGTGELGWMVWALSGLLLAGILLAFVIGGVYYLMNDGTPSPSHSGLPATAIYKMTATKRAILDDLAMRTPPLTATAPFETPPPTVPPTNTRQVMPSLTPVPDDVLPLDITEDATE